ncbi:fra a 1-associated protein [Andrographis paniculata]|uniref:fra a 1-associated protein n=1 Tax=Andrographis paniculata TaxID=175694 RepID=UPI0021E6EEF4|nr:fra a 1-associated protein [Andrographis paniculata]
MGWVWNNTHDDDDNSTRISSSAGDVGEFRRSSNPYGNESNCATRKVVSSQCRTEEVEPGKFIRKCEKTEQVFKDCLGRSSEMIQSNKEYTEEDVTDQMTKGSFPFESGEHGPWNFPGLRNDIDAIERNIIDGIDRFFQAAEDMKSEFFNSVRFPHVYDKGNNRGIFVEDSPPKEALGKEKSGGDVVDLSGLARDV